MWLYNLLLTPACLKNATQKCFCWSLIYMQKSIHTMYSLMNLPSMNTYVTRIQTEKQNISRKLEIIQGCDPFQSLYHFLTRAATILTFLTAEMSLACFYSSYKLNPYSLYLLCLVSWHRHYRLIQIIGWCSSYRLFILFAVYYSVMWIYHSLFIPSNNNGHLGSF